MSPLYPDLNKCTLKPSGNKFQQLNKKVDVLSNLIYFNFALALICGKTIKLPILSLNFV